MLTPQYKNQLNILSQFYPSFATEINAVYVKLNEAWYLLNIKNSTEK